MSRQRMCSYMRLVIISRENRHVIVDNTFRYHECKEDHLLDVVYGEDYLSRRGGQFLVYILYNRKCHQIRWQRFNGGLRYHNSSCALCHLLVLLEHTHDPRNLSRDVQVMCAILSTSLERRLTVHGEWPNSCDENRRLPGQIGKFGLI